MLQMLRTGYQTQKQKRSERFTPENSSECTLRTGFGSHQKLLKREQPRVNICHVPNCIAIAI